MKINKMGAASPQPIAEHEFTNKTEPHVVRFNSEFVKAQDDQYRERLNTLLDEIDKQGQKLGQIPTYSELKSYRELVRKFVGEAVARMYALQSQTGWDRNGRQKVYTTIKKIDQTLADLTEDVRHGQERQLSIMAKQDAIRGMLIDMYM